MGIIKSIKKAFGVKPSLMEELREVEKTEPSPTHCPSKAGTWTVHVPSQNEVRAKDTLDELKAWVLELLSVTPVSKYLYISHSGMMQVEVDGYTVKIWSHQTGINYSCSIPQVHGVPDLDKAIFYTSSEIDYLGCIMNDTRYSVYDRIRADLKTLMNIMETQTPDGELRKDAIYNERRVIKPWCYEPVPVYQPSLTTKSVWL